jgi:hypothetical protein
MDRHRPRRHVVLGNLFALFLRSRGVGTPAACDAAPDAILVPKVVHPGEVISVAKISGLPKTRSGKIMRRILRKIAEDDFSNLGDISTLADPAVVEDLIQNRQRK